MDKMNVFWWVYIQNYFLRQQEEMGIKRSQQRVTGWETEVGQRSRHHRDIEGG